MRFSKKFKIRDTEISDDMATPFIIAEMACSHDGDTDKAKRLIDAAVHAAADAIQFELFSPDDNIVPHTDVYALLKKIHFSPEQWADIYAYARQHDIAISTFAYDLPSLKLGLRLGTDMIKLNSSDLSNPDMLATCARSGIPFTVGTGSSTMEEIARMLECIYINGGQHLMLMHGLQNFPTDLANAHIRRIAILRSAFDCIVGYADHTDADLAYSGTIDLVAIGMGASILEKHITIDRKERGIDHEAALEPAEFKTYVELMHLAHVARGARCIRPLREHDRKYRRFQKKSIVAARPIEKGAIIARDDIAFLRNPASPGISPMDVDAVIGTTTCCRIERFEQIQQTHINDAREAISA